MKKNTTLSLFVAILFAPTLFSQSLHYTMQNAHAHNDYLHEKPFFEAYSFGYGMIEADIFIQDEELLVAHERKSIKPGNTLLALYINPLVAKIKENNGLPYADGTRLRLLIDIKEDGEKVLRLLSKRLKPHRFLFDMKHNPHAVQIIISGDMPQSQDFKKYDDIFYYDGRPQTNYSASSFKKIALVSTNILGLVKWNPKGIYSETETLKLRSYVDSVHRIGKTVRFWATPSTLTSFKTLTDLGVDFIGSDDLKLLADYLGANSK